MLLRESDKDSAPSGYGDRSHSEKTQACVQEESEGPRGALAAPWGKLVPQTSAIPTSWSEVLKGGVGENSRRCSLVGGHCDETNICLTKDQLLPAPLVAA